MKFTSWLASVAPAAIKPESRPITFTMLMPLCTQMRLDVRRIDHLFRLLDGGEVAEGAVDVLHIVVDGLGDADDRDLEFAALNFLDYAMRPALGAVAADGEQDVDAALLQEIDDDVGADRAARGAQQRAAELMNAVDDLGVQPQRWGGEPRAKIPSSRSGCPCTAGTP